MTTPLGIVLLTLLAGTTIPAGGFLARIESIHPRWLEVEFRHFVMAFGGGALLAAVALVLVPDGSANVSIFGVALWFALGALAFMGLDIALARHRSPSAQLSAMLTDFVPEALALGAACASGESTGLLLAGLIALQNLPEGFNAFREMDAAGVPARKVLGLFALLPLLGPAAGLAGYFWLAELPAATGALMLFAGGGILYLIFQDIAPQAKLQRHWTPPLGAVAGFLLGLLGHQLLVS